MNSDNKLASRIPYRYWGYIGLFLWGAIALLILRHAPYNLTENAAKSLLLSWSIADQVASPVVTFGPPDLRALLFLPIGYLWTGNIFVAKILTILLLGFVARALYSWSKDAYGAEAAMLSTGMLLLAPASIAAIDSLAPAAYLLIAFAFGAWADSRYRNNPKPFNGWYFAQLFASAFSTSLHPIGIAYPLALLWSWHLNPVSKNQLRFFYIGIGLCTALALIITGGWPEAHWLQNPLSELGQIILPATPIPDSLSIARTLLGSILLLALAIAIIKQWRTLRSHLVGRIALTGLAIGLLVGDDSLQLLGLTVLLLFGLPLLLRTNATAPKNQGLIKQRGWALFVLFAGSTLFMHADKMHYMTSKDGILSPQDQLIAALVDEAAQSRAANEKAIEEGKKAERFRVASQWPSRTMIACKCDTLPLPPAAANPEAQLNMLHGVTYLILDPKQTQNLALVRNLSQLGGVIETASLQSGGVLLHVTDYPAAPATPGSM